MYILLFCHAINGVAIKKVGTTVILMETIVEGDGRPKSGVGRKDFQYQQFLMSFTPALTFYSF
jgi:hypothetical protein